jgi:tetratricopeptide (TPR) repeat protein
VVDDGATEPVEDWRTATTVLRAHLAEDPEDAFAWRLLAEASFEARAYAAAVEAADRAIALAPADLPPAEAAAAHRQRAVALARLRRWSEAERSAAAAARLVPGDPAPLVLRSGVLAARGGRPAEAVALLRQAADAGDGDAAAALTGRWPRGAELLLATRGMAVGWVLAVLWFVHDGGRVFAVGAAVCWVLACGAVLRQRRRPRPAALALPPPVASAASALVVVVAAGAPAALAAGGWTTGAVAGSFAGALSLVLEAAQRRAILKQIGG